MIFRWFIKCFWIYLKFEIYLTVRSVSYDRYKFRHLVAYKVSADMECIFICHAHKLQLLLTRNIIGNLNIRLADNLVNNILNNVNQSLQYYV